MADTSALTATPPSGSLEEAQQAFSSLLTPKGTPKSPKESPPEPRPSPDAEQVPPAPADAEDQADVASEEASAPTTEGEDAASQDENADPEETPEVRTIRVKLPDGEQALPEDEVAKGYIRQADYTRKTMELAAERKKFAQEELEPTRQERQRYVALVGQLEEALQGLQGEPNWDALKATMSPEQWQSAWIAHQQSKEQLATLQRERERVSALAFADQQQQFRAHLVEEQQKLRQALPEFADPEKGPKLGKALADYALSHGFTPEEAQITDHRLVVLLHKAFQYDQVTARKPSPTNQVTRSIRSAAPGTGGERKSPTKRAQAESRLRQSGSLDDAAAALMETL